MIDHEAIAAGGNTHGRRITSRPGWKPVPCYVCGDPEAEHRLCMSDAQVGTPYCYRNNGHSWPSRHECERLGCECGQYSGLRD